MKNAKIFSFKKTAIAMAVTTVFFTNTAIADSDEIRDLTQPKSTVQVEVIGVDQNSAKFGEYNGLYGNPSGIYPNGALNIRGGGAYKNNESGDTTRWSVVGDNLGLTSRSASASYEDQGNWSVGVGFDQLQHNISNTYNTPYRGSMGGNYYVLPSNLTGGASTGTNPATSSTVIGDLSNMGVSSTRYNTSLSASKIIDKDFNISFEFNNLVQTGAKLQAVAGAVAAGGNAGTSQTIAILPMPTNYQTNTFNLAANWKGDNSHFTASYFGSYFENGYKGFQWQAFNTTGATSGSGNGNPIQTISTAPSNFLNQLNLAGGYDFSSKTKLTGNFSISQNTQNQGFSGSYDPGVTTSSANNGMMAQAAPYGSLNGVVNTTHADLKVTDQSVKDLTLTAAGKFDQRDNLTQSNMYNFFAVDGTSSTRNTPHMSNIPNTPESIKQAQILLGADYRITNAQRVSLTLENSNVNRWCNQYGTPGQTPATYYSSATIATGSTFYNSSGCMPANASVQNSANALYKVKVVDGVNVKLGAGYSNRQTTWDNTNSMMAISGNSSPSNWNINYPGFYPFFEASRRQYSGKGSVDWQTTEQLSFTLGGKYTSDTYPNSVYGVQNGYSWSLNLDSTYAYAEAGTINAYVTQQSMQRVLSDQSTVGVYFNQLQTNATTIGLGLKQGGLLNGKVTLNADATLSLANSIYNTTSTPGVCATANAGYCGSAPGIQNNLAILKLGGNYQLDKNSKLGMQYWYQRLYSSDYFYNAYSVSSGGVSGIMPTNQTAPSYAVNAVMVNYTYTFD
ncbi:hypothetical protein DCO17_08005 [Polynucleobacter tropicus]|uniref:MtrB/PioB family decaheme-associated outer membrane protein n=1 Tax=Polynucleobacter tropicus TaxID=1743174 RepID=A0A6M9PZ55_9BURK|nr:MtrB/PioB family decaheme-associated outer membrane protein [Polynucleobacter tropicus]QKM65182.1 hypothetical protein DCO17_08005 [Polynucleobacter tropicus]